MLRCGRCCDRARRWYAVGMSRLLSLAVLLSSAWGALAYGALVPDVRALLNQGDFPAAEKLITNFQKQNGITPEMLEAQSWLGRAALAQMGLGRP